MTITSDVLSKKAIALYEAREIGRVFCVMTDQKCKKLRFFGVETTGADAEKLYFNPGSVVGFSDAVTLKNRAAFRGRFSLPGGLKTMPMGGEIYSPGGKRLGTLDSVETENGAITAFVASGVAYPSSRLVSFSENIMILSETEEKYRVSPPRTRVPKVRDDRTVIISEAAVSPVATAKKMQVAAPDEQKSEAKISSYPAPGQVEKSDSDETETTDEKTVLLPVKATAGGENAESRAVAAIKPIDLRSHSATSGASENYAPVVRSSVTLPPRADVTVTKTPVSSPGSKTGYYFLIGKTMTRTLLGDDGKAIISQGERITAETLGKAEGKLVLLALYSK